MNLPLLMAGVLAIAIGLAHSVLGERLLLRPVFERGELPKLLGSRTFARRTLRFAWHLTTLLLAAIGAIVMAMAFSTVETQGVWILRCLAVTFAACSALSLIGSRGRHFSWWVFLIIAALIWVGIGLTERCPVSMKREQNLDLWLERWADCWSVPSLPAKVTVEFSRRLRRSFGRCTPGTGSIRLHPALLEEPIELLTEVLCHEAAHVAVRLKHGRPVRPHGPEWAELMKLAGFAPRARLRVDQLSPALARAMRPRARYRHRCPACGAQRLARRAMLRWRCRRCVETGKDGRLEILRQPA